MDLPRHPLKEPLVWLVVGIPAYSVVAGLTTFWLAAHGADPIVSAGFDKQGMSVAHRTARDDRGRELNVAGTIRAEKSGDALMLKVAFTGAGDASASPPMLRLGHPSRADADRVLRLHPAIGGGWEATMDARDAAASRWTLTVETPEWRVAVAGLHPLEPKTPLTFGAAAK